MALWFLSPGFRSVLYNLLVERPNLQIEELPDIFNGNEYLQTEHNPAKRMLEADRSVRVYGGKISIIYHVTAHADGSVAETVDIAYKGKLGMIFILLNDKITCLQRIGGATYNNPALNIEEEAALMRFMIELRNCFK